MEDHRQAGASGTERAIIEAAIGVFLRFGAKKTTMADIAEAAGVSRQTVYATFGDKDGVIVGCIRHISAASLTAIRTRLVGCEGLGARLNVYFEETVVKSFEMLKTSGDPEDLISGHNKAGKAAIEESHARQAALVAEILLEREAALMRRGHTPETVANFIVTVAMGLKYGLDSREALDARLAVLTDSILALTTPPTA